MSEVALYCSATHPTEKRTNFRRGYARGRKLHLTLDKKTTLCNMKYDEIVEEHRDYDPPDVYRIGTQINKGLCKNCAVVRDKEGIETHKTKWWFE